MSTAAVFRAGLVAALAAAALMAVPAGSAETQPAPPFELPRLNGEGRVSLDDYRGTVVLLDFWASWCPPCRESLPDYNEIRNQLQAQYGKTAFEVLAVNLDLNRGKALEFLDEYQPDYPVLRESGHETQRQYELMGMPTAFLIDARGRIRHSWQGYARDYRPELIKRIEKLIREREKEG